jgi:hypothetical protein
LITGRCPYVTVSKTSEFTIEARVVFLNNSTGEIRLSTIASERTFSLTIRSIFASDGVTSLQISVPPATRSLLAQWIWGTAPELRDGKNIPHNLTILGKDQVFRANDVYFGKKRDYRIMLVSGLNYLQNGSFLDKLRDYHHPTTLRVGKVQSARAVTPDGKYIYDVIYMTTIDPMAGAGGFDAQGREELLARQPGTAIPVWNMTKDADHYYPNSIRNMRADLINRFNRLPWGENNETMESRGLGVSGREGLPLWQMSEQIVGDPSSIPGYQCVIELAYVNPGSGPGIVKTLTLAGMNEAVQGLTIPVDRYLLLSDGTSNTTFDGPEYGLDEITTFDGPDNAITPTSFLTTFDTSLQSESKYYKFPPGDQKRES